ncbi:unnamed protein product [Nezara viridula]|uniref:Uncharacterized protein n=1 Tax=Nezara viridula TaxID=85310 RepID=A0A9P0GX27_NEZVI|nr:unnamed protein product [Nezara viridula]
MVETISFRVSIVSNTSSNRQPTTIPRGNHIHGPDQDVLLPRHSTRKSLFRELLTAGEERCSSEKAYLPEAVGVLESLR